MIEAARYDLVVIGMGAAGLAASVSHVDAAAAAGRAARVAVVERALEAERGGATRYTSAWFRVTEDRRLDPNFVDLMESVSGGLTDLDYCCTLEREVSATIDFLDEHEVEVTYFKQPFPNRNTGGGLGMPVGGGIAIVEGLGGILERTDGVELLYETEAVRLSVSEEGRIDGVVVRGRDGLLRTLGAGAVVIASGGFEGGGMLTQYLGERACDLPVIAPGPANNRGEGIRMAMEVGADTAGQFDMFHAEPVDPRASKPDPVFYPYVYGIVVNGRAERFFDEGRNSFDSTFEALGYEIWRDPGQTAFFIGDQTTLGIEPIEAVIFTDVPPVTAARMRRARGAARTRCVGARAHRFQEYNAAVGPEPFDPYVFDGKSTRGLATPKSNWACPARLAAVRRVPAHLCDHVQRSAGCRTDSSARVVSPGPGRRSRVCMPPEK